MPTLYKSALQSKAACLVFTMCTRSEPHDQHVRGRGPTRTLADQSASRVSLSGGGCGQVGGGRCARQPIAALASARVMPVERSVSFSRFPGRGCDWSSRGKGLEGSRGGLGHTVGRQERIFGDTDQRWTSTFRTRCSHFLGSLAWLNCSSSCLLLDPLIGESFVTVTDLLFTNNYNDNNVVLIIMCCGFVIRPYFWFTALVHSV